jgi:4-amino-4-deoxy-L-arabinose transferase and related glycosyltransferases of PMT family
MKKYLPIILILSTIKLIIHWFGNQKYGFHRDELLHLSVSEHLDGGFMEFPPFIGVIGKISYWLLDYLLLGVRLFPALGGVGILILCCLITKELGGKSKEVLLSGICILAFLPFQTLVQASKEREKHYFGSSFEFERPIDNEYGYVLNIKKCLFHETLKILNRKELQHKPIKISM